MLKIIKFNHILLILFIGFVIIAFILANLDTTQSRLPSELELAKPSYEANLSHTFGPGGLNHSIWIYDIPPNVLGEISRSGLSYLNSLPSTQNYQTNKFRSQFYSTEKYWKPFKEWQNTPIVQDDKWIRKSWIVGRKPQPTLSQFIAKNDDSEFIKSIPPDTYDLIQRMIQSEGNYYAYGGYRNMGVLILSPSDKKALYLFRD